MLPQLQSTVSRHNGQILYIALASELAQVWGEINRFAYYPDAEDHKHLDKQKEIALDWEIHLIDIKMSAETIKRLSEKSVDNRKPGPLLIVQPDFNSMTDEKDFSHS